MSERDAQILEGAVEVLREGGWTILAYGDTYRPNTPHCLVGAVITSSRLARQVRRESTLGGKVLDDMHSALRFVRKRVGEPTEWNDGVARDADEVIGVLKLAAEDARLG